MSDLTAYITANGIRTILAKPAWQGGGFEIALTCGGPAGHGDTVDDALAHARALNADWLDAPARWAA